jgi:hypothetical protein
MIQHIDDTEHFVLTELILIHYHPIYEKTYLEKAAGNQGQKTSVL